MPTLVLYKPCAVGVLVNLEADAADAEYVSAVAHHIVTVLEVALLGHGAVIAPDLQERHVDRQFLAIEQKC